MGIGRREFLRLTGLALVGLTIDPLKAVAVNNNVHFVESIPGISVKVYHKTCHNQRTKIMKKIYLG